MLPLPNATHQQPQPCFLRHLRPNIVHVLFNLPCRRIGVWKGRVVESMNAVTRVLQTVAAIQSETRELVHAEAASRRPIEPLRSQHLSASPLAASPATDRPRFPRIARRLRTRTEIQEHRRSLRL